MADKGWIVRDEAYDRGRIETNGSKFLLGNGYMGYRGTMEEYGKENLTACVLAGVYDRYGNSWREPVNAPNGLYTEVYTGDEQVGLLHTPPVTHTQSLDLKNALHFRHTVFNTATGSQVEIKAERFLSLSRVHLLCSRYEFSGRVDGNYTLMTGIDGDVWDINGPHLESFTTGNRDGVIFLTARTYEKGYTVAVAEAFDFAGGECKIETAEKRILRRIPAKGKAGVSYGLTKYVAVYTSLDPVPDPVEAAVTAVTEARRTGYAALFEEHRRAWQALWENADVEITGDDEAQFALRYSIYHLLAIAPHQVDYGSIPARGLSGQVYKGAIFWDTEMFMLPFFVATNPGLSRKLMLYRFKTLDGARRKAASYGYRGAFYAWESQDTGDDSCTLFNVSDVFTGRPLRTYFADKQIHISGDVVYGLSLYYRLTGDDSILLEGGAETILECARFFMDYAYYHPGRGRYELLDVVGPDEYHERVHNNAFTSRMARFTLETALWVLELLKKKYPAFYAELLTRMDLERDLPGLREMATKLYVPAPDPVTGVIEQFDGYSRLEDVSLTDLKKRIKIPNEYLGGGQGLATTTKIIKQADVLAMLHFFGSDYSPEVKKANWDYYEPRTEHGSSLSACIYALVAAEFGNVAWGYPFFMKTATIDLTGEGKQYLGSLYIGGTHPAANGGAWMAAVLGFGGVHFEESVTIINPRLPAGWESMSFALVRQGQKCRVLITREMVKITADEGNTGEMAFRVKEKKVICAKGKVAEAKI